MMDFQIHVKRTLRESGVPHVVWWPISYMENFLALWSVQRLQQEGMVAFPVGGPRPGSPTRT